MGLEVNVGNGTPPPNEDTVLRAVTFALRDRFWFDTFLQRGMTDWNEPVPRPIQDADFTRLTDGDVYAPDFAFTQAAVDRFATSGKLAHLWLVPNPPHNPRGDFGLSADGQALNQADEKYTFSTIALYRRALFEAPWCPTPAGNPHGVVAPLAPLLRAAMDAGQVSAELYTGPWTDVGTPERLAELNAT